MVKTGLSLSTITFCQPSNPLLETGTLSSLDFTLNSPGFPTFLQAPFLSHHFSITLVVPHGLISASLSSFLFIFRLVQSLGIHY